MAEIHKFSVEIYDPESDDWESLGTVLLPDLAPRRHVEHALAVHGVYAPRGLDWLSWCDGASEPRAIIYDASDQPLVRLGFDNWRNENG